eukprot:5276443-Amphidinium_carterae.1
MATSRESCPPFQPGKSRTVLSASCTIENRNGRVNKARLNRQVSHYVKMFKMVKQNFRPARLH